MNQIHMLAKKNKIWGRILKRNLKERELKHVPVLQEEQEDRSKQTMIFEQKLEPRNLGGI